MIIGSIALTPSFVDTNSDDRISGEKEETPHTPNAPDAHLNGHCQYLTELDLKASRDPPQRRFTRLVGE